MDRSLGTLLIHSLIISPVSCYEVKILLNFAANIVVAVNESYVMGTVHFPPQLNTKTY